MFDLNVYLLQLIVEACLKKNFRSSDVCSLSGGGRRYDIHLLSSTEDDALRGRPGAFHFPLRLSPTVVALVGFPLLLSTWPAGREGVFTTADGSVNPVSLAAGQIDRV